MPQIFCPKCAWKPRPHHMWGCEPSCGYVWHTFDTRGQCPACRKQWNDTECLRCARWSKHELWYHDDPEELARWERLIDATDTEATPQRELEPSQGRSF